MSFVSIKSKYHVALDGVGLLLQGAPNRLGYQQGQAGVYGQRFASGDRSYDDLSQWWYFVQTDWSGGLKDSISWQDDAKYFYSTNVDVWSEIGAIKLSRKQTLDETFTEDIICGVLAEVNGTTSQYVGTDDGSDSRPHIYQATTGELQTWTDVSTTTIATSQNVVSQLSGRLGLLWVSTVGSGTTYVVITWDGTTWVDQSAAIYNGGATISFQPGSSRCHVEYAGTQYVFVDGAGSTNKYALVKTTASAPSVAGDWSKVFEKTLTQGRPIACAAYNGKIHYIVNFTSHCEYWQYDVTAATNTLVRRFDNVNIENWGMGDKLMVELNGKLIITIPNNEIWELDGSTLTRIFAKDEFKRDTLTSFSHEADCHLRNGATVANNKLWWGNLMYDGATFYNTFKDSIDGGTTDVSIMYADTSNRLWHTDSDNTKKLYFLGLESSVYKGSADENYLVLNNFDTISGVEKLAYSVTILFKPFASGQALDIEYMTGELTNSQSWTSLGTASATLDGTSVRSKTFYFPAGTTFNKLWFRVKLTGGGTNTPTLNDLVMEYLPIPTYKKTWTLNVNCGDEVRRLDGALVETVGRELKSRLEHSWWTKSVLDFQDLDYATTLLNGALNATDTTITVDSTYDFPEKGRFRIDDEEITYTGKTPTTFTGCTRGARSTRATTHSNDAVLNNAYKVLITNFQTSVPILLEDKEIEYTVGLTLREV